MSHPGSGSRIPKVARDDNDQNDDHDNGSDLQPTPLSLSNSPTGQPSTITTARPNGAAVSVNSPPTATTTTEVYNLPASILEFPSSTPPISSNFTRLPDGSSLTSLYTEDLAISNARLFGGSALLTLFIINVWIAITFLRRAQLSFIKDKTLFYLLLASQVMGPVAFVSLLVPFFSRSANCTTYVRYSSKLP